MKKYIAIGMLWLGVGVATGAMGAGYISGPEGEFKTRFGRSLEYDPSRACIKPMKPYGNDKYAMELYISSAKDYIGCMENAANRDVEYAQKIILAGYEEAAQDYINEVRRGY